MRIHCDTEIVHRVLATENPTGKSNRPKDSDIDTNAEFESNAYGGISVGDIEQKGEFHEPVPKHLFQPGHKPATYEIVQRGQSVKSAIGKQNLSMKMLPKKHSFPEMPDVEVPCQRNRAIVIRANSLPYLNYQIVEGEPKYCLTIEYHI